MTRRRLPTQTGKECQPKGLAPFPTSSPRARWRLSARPRRARIKSRGGRRKAPPLAPFKCAESHYGHSGRSRNSTSPLLCTVPTDSFPHAFTQDFHNSFHTIRENSIFLPWKVFHRFSTGFSTPKHGVFHIKNRGFPQ